MKMFLLLVCVFLGGCAYNSQYIYADNGSTVYADGTVDKPVDVGTTLQGNVPLNGGSVINPAQNVQPKP